MILRAIAVLTFGLSLALKLHGSYVSPQEDASHARAAVVARLQAAGFSIQASPPGYMRVVATRRECRVAARMLDPHGTTDSVMRLEFAAVGSTVYAYAGEWRETLPRWAPLLEYYFRREVARQGIASNRNPVWIVAFGKGCEPKPDAALFDVPLRLIPTR